jgi:preprotein translocase subunit YajC
LTVHALEILRLKKTQTTKHKQTRAKWQDFDEVVTKAGLTNLIEVVTKAGLTVT